MYPIFLILVSLGKTFVAQTNVQFFTRILPHKLYITNNLSYTHPVSFHVFDPFDGLSLWVYHERPAMTGGDNHSVFC